MKRVSNLYDRISDLTNMCDAFHKAAKGKQDRPEVLEFRKNFDDNIQKLQMQFLSREFDFGHYRFFKVFDPKPRSICAAAFPERVVHHAIMNICSPHLDAYAIHESYACRKDKGNRKAIEKAQSFSSSYKWFLKLDIRKYFDTIDHSIVMAQLERRFKDRDLLGLFQRILETYQSSAGKGLPIGNLISQHLANFYLGWFDHWVKEQKRVKGYVRYMDDFILFSNDKSCLKEGLQEIEFFLSQRLALGLKSNRQLNRCENGIPFLGYRIYPYHIRLSTSSRKRFVTKFRVYENRWKKGDWSTQTLSRHMEPLMEFARYADSLALRRDVMNQYGVSF